MERAIIVTRLLHVPMLLAAALAFASIHRPPPAIPVAPAAGTGTKWEWSNRAIRHERWNAPAIIPNGTTLTTASLRNSGTLLRWENRLMGSLTSTANGSLILQTYDLAELRIWPTAIASLGVSIAGILVEWVLRKQWRQRAGHCPSCGYDLRASPQRCPECGRPVQTICAGRET